MNIKGLRIFVYIVEEGTLAKASARISLSQPAASRLLGIVEDSLGGELFYRRKNRLVPTPEGEKFYPEALRLLAMLDGMAGTFRDIQQGSTRPLRIACYPRLLHSLVIPALASLLHRYPDLHTQLVTLSRKDLVKDVEKNVYDVGIGSLPVPNEQLRTSPICKTRLYVVLHKDNPLANERTVNSLQLKDLPYISLDDNSLIRQLVVQNMADSFQELKPQHRVSTIASACQSWCRKESVLL